MECTLYGSRQSFFNEVSISVPQFQTLNSCKKLIPNPIIDPQWFESTWMNLEFSDITFWVNFAAEAKKMTGETREVRSDKRQRETEICMMG